MAALALQKQKNIRVISKLGRIQYQDINDIHPIYNNLHNGQKIGVMFPLTFN